MNMKLEVGGSMLAIFLMLVIFKLLNIIAWSWWWIAAPIWAPPLILLIAVFSLVWFVK